MRWPHFPWVKRTKKGPIQLLNAIGISEKAVFVYDLGKQASIGDQRSP